MSHPWIRYENHETGGVLGENLLESLLKKNLPVDYACTQGNCGTDLIRVVEGAEHLTAPDQHELDTLKRMSAPEGARLACQARIASAGEIVIERIRRSGS